MFTINKTKKQVKYAMNAHMFFNDMLQRDVFGEKDDSKFDDLNYDFVVHRNAAVRTNKHYQTILCPNVHTLIDSLGEGPQGKGQFTSEIMKHATVSAQNTGVPLARIMEEPVVFHQDKFGYSEVIFKCIRIRPVGDDLFQMGDF